MGKVMVVQEKSTGKLYAIKSIHKHLILERHELQHSRSERDIMAMLVPPPSQSVPEKEPIRCPFLIRLHAAFQDRSNIYYLLDYHGGGDLAGILAQRIRLPEATACLYLAEIASALRALHTMGIVYRDLKPENILVARNGHLVLTDFGLSKILAAGGAATVSGEAAAAPATAADEGRVSTRTFCGTPEYLAPEILLRAKYDFAVDCWSLGVLMYEMLVGVTPFWSDTPVQMYTKIVSAQYQPEFPPAVSPAARSLISKLLCRQPGQRLTIAQVQTHEFFSGIDWDKLDRLEYAPPLIPGVSSAVDLAAFDRSFTTLPPVITPDDDPSPMLATSTASRAFQNFSYRGERKI